MPYSYLTWYRVRPAELIRSTFRGTFAFRSQVFQTTRVATTLVGVVFFVVSGFDHASLTKVFTGTWYFVLCACLSNPFEISAG